jgi:hypothetical protein
MRDDPPGVEELCHALANRRRRVIIRILRDLAPLQARDLATQVVAAEQDIDPTHVTASDRNTVYVSLYQTHLPTLNTTCIITYDARSKLVECGDCYDRIAQLLGQIDRTGAML